MAPTVRADATHRLPVDPDVSAARPPGPRSRRGGPARAGRNGVVVLALACGGAVGAVARDAVFSALPTPPGQFPWATFAVNVSGSLVLGFLLVLVLEQFPGSRLARPVIGTGFIGAFTTFSTFMVDAVQLVRDGRAATAAVYIVASLLAGLAAVWLGMLTARLTMRAERWLQEGGR